MQKGSGLRQTHDKPNLWRLNHAGCCGQLHTTANGRRITILHAEALQLQKLCSLHARGHNPPAGRGWLQHKHRLFVTAASHGAQKTPTSATDWSHPVSRATSQLLWRFAPTLAQFLQQASGDQPSLSALLAAEFITVANNWKQERVSSLPPIRKAGLGALIDGWTVVQENFYLRHSISATYSRPQVPEDSTATPTNASANAVSILSSVLVDPVTLIIAPELSAGCDEASLSAWLSQRGLLTVTPLNSSSQDNKAMRSLYTAGKHAFVMQQILELVMSPGTQRIIASFPPTPAAGWLATAATRVVAVSNALGTLPSCCRTDGNLHPDNFDNSIDNSSSNINGISSTQQQLSAKNLSRSEAMGDTSDVSMSTAVGSKAMSSIHQNLSSLGLVHLQSCVYFPIKDALEPHLGPNLLLCSWLYQLVVATMVLYESNASRSSPDKLIICQAVAADLYTGIRVLQDAGMPLSHHMALYLLTQQLAIGTELHELGMKQDDLPGLAMQVEELAASISASQPGLVVVFDAYHRLGEYHLHVSQDMPAARDALQKALMAFKEREARTCDGFQEWSDDLSVCSLHSYWRDISDTALQQTITKGTPTIQLASLPGAVYLYRDKLRCILSLVLVERLTKTNGSGTLSSNWAAYSADTSLSAVTELLAEAAGQVFANTTTGQQTGMHPARNENGVLDNQQLDGMYFRTTVAISTVLDGWQSSMGIDWQQTTTINAPHSNHINNKKRRGLPASHQTLQLTLADIMSAPQPGLELCRLPNSFTTRYKQHIHEQQQEFLQHVHNLVAEILSTLTTTGFVSHNQQTPVPYEQLGLLQDGSIVVRLICPTCLELLEAWRNRPPGTMAQLGTDLHSVLLVAQEVLAAVRIDDHGSDYHLLSPILATELPAVTTPSHSTPTRSKGKLTQKEVHGYDQLIEHPCEIHTHSTFASQLFGGQRSTDMWRACQQLRCIQQADHAQLVAAIWHAKHLLDSCGARRNLWASLLEMQVTTIANANGCTWQQADAAELVLLSPNLVVLQQAAAAGNVQQVFRSFQTMLSITNSLLSGCKLDNSVSSSSVHSLAQLHSKAEHLLVEDVVAACNNLLQCASVSEAAEAADEFVNVSEKQDDLMLHLCSGCMYQALQLGFGLSCHTGAQLQAAVLCGCALHDHKLVVMVLKQVAPNNTSVHPAALSQCVEHYLASGRLDEAVTVIQALACTGKLQPAAAIRQYDNEHNTQGVNLLLGSMTRLVWMAMQMRDASLPDRITRATLALPILGSNACMDERQRGSASSSIRIARFQVLDQICAAALHLSMYEWLETSLTPMLTDGKYDGGIGMNIQPPQSTVMAVTEPAQLQETDSPLASTEGQQQGILSGSYESLASRLAAVLTASQLTAKNHDTLLALQWSVMETARNATTDSCYTVPATEFVDHVIHMLITKDDGDTTSLITQVLEQAATAGYLSHAALSNVLCHCVQSSSSMLPQLANLVPLIPAALWAASLEHAFNTLPVSSNHTVILQLMGWLQEKHCHNVKSSYIPSEQVCRTLLHASFSYVAETVEQMQTRGTPTNRQAAQAQLDVAPELLTYLNSAPAKAQARVFTAAVTLAASAQGTVTLPGIAVGGVVRLSEQQTAWPHQPSTDYNMNGRSESTSEFRHHLFVAMAALGSLSMSRLGNKEPQPLLTLPVRRHRWNKLQATADQAKDNNTDRKQYAATCAQLLQLLADPSPGGGTGIALPTLLPKNGPVVQSKLPTKRLKRPTRWQQGFLPEESNNSAQAQLLCTVYERSFAWCSHDLLEAASLSTLLSVCRAYLIEQKLELAVSVAVAAPTDTSIPLMTFLLNCQEVTNARVLPTTLLVEFLQQACLLRSPALLQQALLLASNRSRLPALIKSIRRQTFASMMLLLLRQPPTSVALALTRAWVEHQHTQRGKSYAQTSGAVAQPAGNVLQRLHGKKLYYSASSDEEMADSILARHLGSSVWHSIAKSCLQHVTLGNSRESCLIGVELAMVCVDQCHSHHATLTRCAVAAAVIQTDQPVRYAIDSLTATEKAIAMCEISLQPGPVLDAVVTLLNQVMDTRSQQLQLVAEHIAAISSMALPVLSKLPVKQRQALSDTAHRALIVMLCEHAPAAALDAWQLWLSTREGLKLSRDARSRLLVAACDQTAWDVAFELSTDLLRNEWPLVIKNSSKPVPSARWHQLGLEEKLAHISVLSACQGRIIDCFQVLQFMLESGDRDQLLHSLPKTLLRAIEQGLTHQDCSLNAGQKSAVSQALGFPFHPSSQDHTAQINGDLVKGTNPIWSRPAQDTIRSVFTALSDLHRTAN